ncbi:TIGR02466 family protein [Lichenifustis flavocetrariae]|uniref:2OG-Fe(II) oxygenase family protein n=1 Tax=Lichenifustis flavocetrariae TaxID=2949735 RepID=A0AA42CHU1_9HYPH|nr:TIGR02466 family protein [Lichenifustis flavocetrariae]MCW6507893.1 2OG-Fe(II) oxygenase family protein [Lichenifustis flavocetrariae]
MATRMNIAVRGLFATPVAALEVPNAAALNEALSAAILARREAYPSVQASNAGGWHSDREILDWGAPWSGQIIDLAKGIAGQMTTDRQGALAHPSWKIQAWANVNTAGHANVCHYHAGSFWSGTYYVDDGGCASDHSLGGEFEMLDPRGPGPGMYAPHLKFAGEDGASVGGAEIIRPKPGLMVLFPSWLMHQVRPYRGTRARISIAFNLSL